MMGPAPGPGQVMVLSKFFVVVDRGRYTTSETLLYTHTAVFVSVSSLKQRSALIHQFCFYGTRLYAFLLFLERFIVSHVV